MTVPRNSAIIVTMFRTSTFSPHIYLSPSLTLEDLAGSPLAINGMKLLHYVEQTGGVPLTQSLGAFHRKCVEWAAHEFQWPGFEPETLYSVNKVLNEPDFPPLSIFHQALQDLRIIRHYRGKALITKRGMSMLGNYGELQVALAEWILASPLQDRLSAEAAALFWDLRHMLGVISNRLGVWVAIGDLTEWMLPVELFPGRGSLGPRHEASFFIAYNFVRPLIWLGLLEGGPQNTPAMSVIDRQFRKTVLFDKCVRISLPTGVATAGLH